MTKLQIENAIREMAVQTIYSYTEIMFIYEHQIFLFQHSIPTYKQFAIYEEMIRRDIIKRQVVVI